MQAVSGGLLRSNKIYPNKALELSYFCSKSKVFHSVGSPQTVKVFGAVVIIISLSRLIGIAIGEREGNAETVCRKVEILSKDNERDFDFHAVSAFDGLGSLLLDLPQFAGGNAGDENGSTGRNIREVARQEAELEIIAVVPGFGKIFRQVGIHPQFDIVVFPEIAFGEDTKRIIAYFGRQIERLVIPTPAEGAAQVRRAAPFCGFAKTDLFFLVYLIAGEIRPIAQVAVYFRRGKSGAGQTFPGRFPPGGGIPQGWGRRRKGCFGRHGGRGRRWAAAQSQRAAKRWPWAQAWRPAHKLASSQEANRKRGNRRDMETSLR